MVIDRLKLLPETKRYRSYNVKSMIHYNDDMNLVIHPDHLLSIELLITAQLP